MMPASAILMIVVCAGVLVAFIREQSKLLSDRLTGLPDWRTEWLRGALMKHTGQNIDDMRVIGGVWLALTATGWMTTSDLLKQPKMGK